MKHLKLVGEATNVVHIELACRPAKITVTRADVGISKTTIDDLTVELAIAFSDRTLVRIRQQTDDTTIHWEAVTFETPAADERRDALRIALALAANGDAELITTTLQPVADGDDLLHLYFDVGFYPLALH